MGSSDDSSQAALARAHGYMAASRFVGIAGRTAFWLSFLWVLLIADVTVLLVVQSAQEPSGATTRVSTSLGVMLFSLSAVAGVVAFFLALRLHEETAKYRSALIFPEWERHMDSGRRALYGMSLAPIASLCGVILAVADRGVPDRTLYVAMIAFTACLLPLLVWCWQMTRVMGVVALSSAGSAALQIKAARLHRNWRLAIVEVAGLIVVLLFLVALSSSFVVALALGALQLTFLSYCAVLLGTVGRACSNALRCEARRIAATATSMGSTPGTSYEIFCTAVRLVLDRKVRTSWDGRSMGSESLKRGFTLKGNTEPGKHRLGLRWGIAFTHLQRIPVLLECPGDYCFTLRFRRKRFSLAEDFALERAEPRATAPQHYDTAGGTTGEKPHRNGRQQVFDCVHEDRRADSADAH